jgi:2-polyprenyl-6-methoxyphenol hydroxylase-like FAD-dependent oxidoreductase
MADVVIVGAGPVGLWTALQIRKRMPTVTVTVYERHKTYQRSHILRLDHWSLLLYSRNNLNASEQEFYSEVTGKRVVGVHLEFARSLYIRTNDFEAALRAYAIREGISVEHRLITSLSDVESLHPECTVFIASDGAHSRCRHELLGEHGLELENLQHVLELKFEETGGPRKFDARQLWECNRHLNFTLSEYVGRRRGEVTPVTARLFLDEETYAQLPDMSFKAPCEIDSSMLPGKVQADIAAYLRTRARSLGTRYIEGSGKLSKLGLSLYAARRFGFLRANKAWFLVGDAAMGVPYFRALNSGMMLGSRLAMLVASNGLAPNQLKRLVHRYELHRRLHVWTEFTIARGKDVLINGVKAIRARFARHGQSADVRDVHAIQNEFFN